MRLNGTRSAKVLDNRVMSSIALIRNYAIFIELAGLAADCIVTGSEMLLLFLALSSVEDAS